MKTAHTRRHGRPVGRTAALQEDRRDDAESDAATQDVVGGLGVLVGQQGDHSDETENQEGDQLDDVVTKLEALAVELILVVVSHVLPLSWGLAGDEYRRLH